MTTNIPSTICYQCGERPITVVGDCPENSYCKPCWTSAMRHGHAHGLHIDDDTGEEEFVPGCPLCAPVDPVNVFWEICFFLDRAGVDAALEGGGAGCTYVAIHDANPASFYILGDVAGNWTMDEYTSYSAWEEGVAPCFSHDLGIERTSTDAPAIAQKVMEVVL